MIDGALMTKYFKVPIGELRLTKARKNHQCTRCRQIISAGTYYYEEHNLIWGLARPLVVTCESRQSRGNGETNQPESDIGEKA